MRGDTGGIIKDMDKKTGWIVVLVFAVSGLLYAFITYTGAPENMRGQQETPLPIANPFGTVTKKSADGFTILGIGNKSITVHTTDKTEFLTGGSAKSSADISVGTIVSITSSTQNTDGSITASVVQILPPPPAQ